MDLPGSEAMRALDDTCRAIFYELLLAADGQGVVMLDDSTLITLCGIGLRSPETVLRGILSCARVGLLYLCDELVQLPGRKKPVYYAWFQVGRWHGEFRIQKPCLRPERNPYKWRPLHTEKTEVRVDHLDEWVRGWSQRYGIRPVVVELALDHKASLIRTQEALRSSGLVGTSKVEGGGPLPPSNPPLLFASLEAANAATPPSPHAVRKVTESDGTRQAEMFVSPAQDAGDGIPDWALSDPPEGDPMESYAAHVVASTVVSPKKGRTTRIFEQREIVAFFSAEYRAAYGREFVYVHRYECSIMAALIEKSRGDLREVKERIVNAFRCDWMRQSGVSLGTIHRFWNRLVVAPATFAPKLTNTDASLKTLMEIVRDDRQQAG